MSSQFITREEALTVLWKGRGKFENEDRLEEFEQREKEIKNTPVLMMTLAIDINSEEALKILEKAREVVNSQLFLNIRVDPSIIGGCILVWNGRVHDYSLRKIIADKKGEFRKLLNEKWK